MDIILGIKSDPIQYRYSYRWLFDLMNDLDIRFMQLGSFPEMYNLEDDYFLTLRDQAQKAGVEIKSCFTAHRELGGFFSPDPLLQKVARNNYERYIHIASLLGAGSVGSNPGSVLRDELAYKTNGIQNYLETMKALMELAKNQGLQFLSVEPMSCLAEPPSVPEELDYMFGMLGDFHRGHPDTTVPAYACSDISHGYADAAGRVIFDNYRLFEYQIPYMAEFHIKNTDERFESTFGFGPAEGVEGIVNLERVRDIINRNRGKFPVKQIVGYLELGGPKLGRDYSDMLLRDMIVASVTHMQQVFTV